MKQRQEMEQKNSNYYQEEEEEEDKYMGAGVAIHSQVRKIKQELEDIKYQASLELPEMRPAFREITRQRSRSRSPLGLTQRPSISVRNS